MAGAQVSASACKLISQNSLQVAASPWLEEIPYQYNKIRQIFVHGAISWQNNLDEQKNITKDDEGMKIVIKCRPRGHFRNIFQPVRKGAATLQSASSDLHTTLFHMQIPQQ